jgi:hypothetical protein
VLDIVTTYVAICRNLRAGWEFDTETFEGSYLPGLELMVRGVLRNMNHQNSQSKEETLLLGYCQSYEMSQVRKRTELKVKSKPSRGVKRGT